LLITRGVRILSLLSEEKVPVAVDDLVRLLTMLAVVITVIFITTGILIVNKIMKEVTNRVM
jgi:hypothetical protein